MSDDNQEDQKPALRRSTRATRGSIKPVVNLKEEPQLVLSEDEEDKQKSSGSKKKSQPKAKPESDYEEDNDDVQILDLSDNDQDEDFEVTKPKRASTSKGKRQSTSSTAAKRHSASGIEKVEKISKKATTSKQKVETTTSKSSTTTTKATKNSSKSSNESVKEEQESRDNIDDPDCIDVGYELSEKEMKEINNAFDLNCASGGQELLASDDLKTAIRSLGFEPRADEIQRLLKKFANKDGKVNRGNFHKIMAFKMGSSLCTRDNDSNNEITRVFNLLDLDKTGMITLENLKSISQELNEEITDEELHEMIAEADIDGDFQINKQEFYNIMKKTSLY